ncbi:MAG: molybdopterin-guanine dinucleotide biosynthesis protein MobA, partial [Bacteroidetes bacterium]
MTSNDKHHKHPPLARPALGEFARQEWALLGTPCGEIQTLAARLIERLSPRWKLAYVDADHAAGETPNDSPLARAHLRYTDKIAFHRLDWQGNADRFHLRPLFRQVDAALVNGNHFPAQRQIVVIDPRKDESLQRKRERLTDVELLLLTPDGRR